MKFLILFLFPLTSFAFTKDSEDVYLHDTTINGLAKPPLLLNTNLPDLNVDGTYVVYDHPEYSYGGGFAHLTLRNLLRDSV